jgi:hypothetical protein
MNPIHITASPTSKIPNPHTLPISIERQCPSCGSSEVRSSARHGFFEQIALRLRMKGPFLCYDCGRRFYDSVLT